MQEYESTPQRSQMRMSEPRLQSPDGPAWNTPATKENLKPMPNEADRESLFEELSDPFTDDEARVQHRRHVRTSSYQQATSRHSRKRSSRRNYSTAGRDFKSLR